MNEMNRKHGFENALNQVRKGRKYYYIYHERTAEGRGIRVGRNATLDKAFASGDWAAFRKAEARAISEAEIYLENGRTIKQ